MDVKLASWNVKIRPISKCSNIHNVLSYSTEPLISHLQSTHYHNLVVSNNKMKRRCWLKNSTHHIITKPSHPKVDFELAQHHFCQFKFRILWRTHNTIGLEVEANANMSTKYWEHPHSCTRNSAKNNNPQSQLWSQSWCKYACKSEVGAKEEPKP